MKKILAFGILIILGIILFYRIYTVGQEEKRRMVAFQGNISVSASIYPLSYLASKIAGPDMPVHTITPPTIEPHDYELSPQDLSMVTASSIVFLIGNFEPWEHKIPVTDGKPVVLKFIHAFDTADLLTDQYGTVNPHVWVSPKRALTLVQATRDAFIQARPKEKADFIRRAQELATEITAIDASYRNTLQTCKKRDFVTSHNAFAYLARDYNLNQIPIAGLSPDQEPSPKTLAELQSLVRQKGITTIFIEELSNPKFAQTVAREAKVTTAVLSPIEGLTQEEVSSQATYLTLLTNNLTALSKELSCD
jgi:zinc transport system substrate-binding protein